MFSGLGNTHLVFINGYSESGISAFGLCEVLVFFVVEPVIWVDGEVGW